jgi:hypothetical protein
MTTLGIGLLGTCIIRGCHRSNEPAAKSDLRGQELQPISTNTEENDASKELTEALALDISENDEGEVMEDLANPGKTLKVKEGEGDSDSDEN